MTYIDDADWADNPRLNGWLAAQAARFPGWAEELGGDWDFTVDSLDGVERAVRDRFSSLEAATAARDEPFMAVAAWYVGEVQVRNYGAMWRCSPESEPAPYARVHPAVRLPKEVLDHSELTDLAEKEELYEDDFPCCWTFDAVRAAADTDGVGYLRSLAHEYGPWQSVVDRALAWSAERPPQSPGGRLLADAPGPLDAGPVGEDMARWLAEQAARFPAWVAATGRPDDLNFTPSSLDVLETVLRERIAEDTSTSMLYDDPIFYGALWYLGEVVCRSRGARWMPIRANEDVTRDRLGELTVALVGDRIGPQTELTSAIHRSIRGVRHPDDSYEPLRTVLDDYPQA